MVPRYPAPTKDSLFVLPGFPLKNIRVLVVSGFDCCRVTCARPKTQLGCDLSCGSDTLGFGQSHQIGGDGKEEGFPLYTESGASFSSWGFSAHPCFSPAPSL